MTDIPWGYLDVVVFGMVMGAAAHSVFAARMLKKVTKTWQGIVRRQRRLHRSNAIGAFNIAIEPANSDRSVNAYFLVNQSVILKLQVDGDSPLKVALFDSHGREVTPVPMPSTPPGQSRH